MCLTTKLNTKSFLTIKSNMIAIGKKRTNFNHTIQPSKLSVNIKLNTNKQKIANEFNKYFATICANNQIPTTNTSYKSNLTTQTVCTFNLKLIDNATTMRNCPI